MSPEAEHLHSPATSETAARSAGMTAEALELVGEGEVLRERGSILGGNSPRPAARVQRISQAARVRELTRLQRSRGNAYVQRLLQRSSPAAGVQLQRDVPPQAEQAAPDLSGLGLQDQRLPGHGQLGGSPAPVTSGTAAAAPASAGVVTATINLTVNAPAIERKPAREIASAHHRPGSAGWTTPRYTISDPIVHGSALTINVTLDFTIELDSRRADEALAVISDHEQGHVHIGESKARQHLVTGFKSALEAMPALSRSGYIAAQNGAINSFVTEEGSDSRDYDTIDYPRMMRANTGASTPLSTLARRFPPIAQAASALRAYNREFLLATHEPFHIILIDDATILARADAVIQATDGIPEEQLNMLQYNPGFKALVTRCRAATNDYLQQQRRGPEFLMKLPSDENVSPPVRDKLQVLDAALGSFTWSAPV